MLLQNPLQHPNILAVTFTNKATQEMKERIIAFLMKLSSGADDGLLKQLKAETSYSNDHIRSNARRALQEILHNYGDFTILTIDSFFNKIIKSFAHEMKLPLRMEVQLDTEEALNEAYDRLMLQLDSDPELSQYLTEFMFYKLGRDKGWQVEREIKDLGKELFKESFSDVFKSLEKMDVAKIQQLLEAIFKRQNEIETTFRSYGDEALTIIADHQLELKDFKGGKNSFANYFRYLADFRVDKLKLSSTQEAAIDNAENWCKKKDPNEAVIFDAFSAGLNRLLKQASSHWEDILGEFTLLHILVKNLHALGLLKSVNDKMIAYRDDNDKILISDQNRIINEIVQQADIPFLYEKTGAQYRHFLLDEFQDTSALQWVNFRPLLENALAENGKVLIVGDGKQSIYRWRGGEMKLLLQQVGEDLAYYLDDETVQNLDSNYRSRQEIIEFNNLFFGEIAPWTDTRFEQDGTLAHLAFEDVSQQSTQQTRDGGYVEMRFIEDIDNGDETIRAKDLIDEELVKRIATLLDEGYAYKDIACLVFNNGDGSRVAELLTATGIPVQSSDSLVVSNAAPVKLIISLLRFLQNPQDTLMRGQIIVLLHQMDLLEAPLHPSLKRIQEEYKAFFELIPNSLEEVLKKNKGNLLHVITQLIEHSCVKDQFAIYLQRLLELVYEFESKNESHIGDFLNWWDDIGHKRTIQAPDDLDAVVILTVHKAKGLQYPVVIMPYAKRGIEPRSELLWIENNGIVDEEWVEYLPINFEKKLKDTSLKGVYEEEKELFLVDALNMLYVAFTRPEERLYVLAALDKDNKDHTAKLIHEYLLVHEGFETAFVENVLKFGNSKLPGSTEQKREHKLSQVEDALVSSTEKELLLRRPRLRVSDIGVGEEKTKKHHISKELLTRMTHMADLEKVLDEAAFEGLISGSEKSHWHKQLQNILKLPEIAYWMENAKEQLSEHEMLTEQGAIAADKVFVLSRQWVALNFIVGEPKKEHFTQMRDCLVALNTIAHKENEIEQVAELPDSQQTSLFADPTESVTPTPKDKKRQQVEAYLLYLDTSQLEKVK